VETLAPRLAEEGLDIISDNRITDLREWLGRPAGMRRRVYVYRHVMVRKNSHSTGEPGLRLQSLWQSPKLSVHCDAPDLNPVLQRSNESAENDPAGPFAWEVVLDFSSVPVGDTVEVVVNIMQEAPPDDRDLARQQWWRFEVDADPEIASSWILFPEDQAPDGFNVVRSTNDNPDVIELVKPTHQTSMYAGSVIHWSVVHPRPGHTYWSRWDGE
jgi:hypothetical protein